jgi:hypothetical protein
MNFVTPKRRQEWLSQAEDYADIVKKLSFKNYFLSFSRFFLSFSNGQNIFYPI